MFKIISGLSIICFSAILPTMVGATSISEYEPNDTFATAQELVASYFSIGGAPSIGDASDIYMSDSKPWVSINSIRPDNVNDQSTNSYDFYSLTVASGTTGYFDIDYGFNAGGSADILLSLYDSNESLLIRRSEGQNYSNYTDTTTGSVSMYDPSFYWEFAETGTYYLGVSLWEGSAIAQGDTYTLQVSLDPAPVPEPTTMLLLGTGLAGLVGSRIRRKKKA